MLHSLAGVNPNVPAHDRSSAQHDASDPPGTDALFGDASIAPIAGSARVHLPRIRAPALTTPAPLSSSGRLAADARNQRKGSAGSASAGGDRERGASSTSRFALAFRATHKRADGANSLPEAGGAYARGLRPRSVTAVPLLANRRYEAMCGATPAFLLAEASGRPGCVAACVGDRHVPCARVSSTFLNRYMHIPVTLADSAVRSRLSGAKHEGCAPVRLLLS